MWQRFLTLAGFITFALSVASQHNVARYRIDFADKCSSPYTLEKPLDYLSPRAIDRRRKLHITIDDSDLPVSPAYTDSLRAAGLRVTCTSKWMNSAIVEGSTGSICKISNLSFVKGKTMVSRLKSTDASFPSHQEKRIEPRKNGKNARNKSLDQVAMLGGLWLHENSYKGEGMLIAVLDAGFLDADEHALCDSAWIHNRIAGTRDIIAPGGDVFNACYHGTSVLSLMAGNSTGTLAGTAPNARYLLVRTEDSDAEEIAEEDYWIAGAEFADSAGADVINSSLGYTLFDNGYLNHSTTELDGETARVSTGAGIAVKKGMAIVVSAGNEGRKSWRKITFPADAKDVITVGAVEPGGGKAFFSSVGPSTDGRIKPEVAALGTRPFALQYNGKLDNALSGTSFSAPLISGLLACLWQSCPSATPAQLKDAIIKSSSQYFSPDSLIGYGIPDFRKAELILEQVLTGERGSDELIVYPSPYRDTLLIDVITPARRTFDVEVIDLHGRFMYEKRSLENTSYVTSIQLQLSEIPEGIYTVSVVTGEERLSKQVVHLR